MWPQPCSFQYLSLQEKIGSCNHFLGYLCFSLFTHRSVHQLVSSATSTSKTLNVCTFLHPHCTTLVLGTIISYWGQQPTWQVIASRLLTGLLPILSTLQSTFHITARENYYKLCLSFVQHPPQISTALQIKSKLLAMVSNTSFDWTFIYISCLLSYYVETIFGFFCFSSTSPL